MQLYTTVVYPRILCLIKMKSFNPKYFIEFQEAVVSHNLKSGEILIDIWEHNKSKFQIPELFDEILRTSEIKCEDEHCEFIEITRAKAMESMRYGLSLKANYTLIDKQFSPSEQNKYARGFLDFFEDCKCYTTESRLYKSKLDLNDFWETGGVIACDNNRVGIFWVNDLYG